MMERKGFVVITGTISLHKRAGDVDYLQITEGNQREFGIAGYVSERDSDKTNEDHKMPLDGHLFATLEV